MKIVVVGAEISRLGAALALFDHESLADVFED